MKDAEEQLAAIGFARIRRETACWRTVRLDGPGFSTRRIEAGPEPACSRPLMRWRDLLARNPVPPPYRISRVDN